jgi:AbrB family looped-hinge helix DNA binding protein
VSKIARFKVSERGQMALPAEVRKRWGLEAGGTVEIADLGDSIVIIPIDDGGFRGKLRQAVDAAGGYEALLEGVMAEDPEMR